MKHFYIIFGLPSSGTRSVLYKLLGQKLCSREIVSAESYIIDCDSYTVNTFTFIPSLLKIDYHHPSDRIDIEARSSGFNHIFIDAGNQVDQHMKHVINFVDAALTNQVYSVTNFFVADLKYLLLSREKILAYRGYIKFRPHRFVGTHYDDFVLLKHADFTMEVSLPTGPPHHGHSHLDPCFDVKSCYSNLEKVGVLGKLSLWNISGIDYISAGQEIPSDLYLLRSPQPQRKLN